MEDLKCNIHYHVLVATPVIGLVTAAEGKTVAKAQSKLGEG